MSRINQPSFGQVIFTGKQSEEETMEVDLYVPSFEQQYMETDFKGKKLFLRFGRCIAITKTSGPGLFSKRMKSQGK
jgi:hypothetical protein